MLSLTLGGRNGKSYQAALSDKTLSFEIINQINELKANDLLSQMESGPSSQDVRICSLLSSQYRLLSKGSIQLDISNVGKQRSQCSTSRLPAKSLGLFKWEKLSGGPLG